MEGCEDCAGMGKLGSSGPRAVASSAPHETQGQQVMASLVSSPQDTSEENRGDIGLEDVNKLSLTFLGVQDPRLHPWWGVRRECVFLNLDCPFVK